MLLKRINLKDELQAIQNYYPTSEDILKEVYSVLDEVDHSHEAITQRIKNKNVSLENDFNLDLLETNRIFHISSIKQTCCTYRLRFLDSYLFKPSLPTEAIAKVRHLEKTHQTQLKGFKIMAPSKLFQLELSDDPLLFAPIGNGYYYLIHQWGNDLHPLRKWLVLPFKNMVNFVWLLFFASIILTAFAPVQAFTKNSPQLMQTILFLFTFKSLVGIAVYYGFAFGKNFNNEIWDSKFIK
jgi:hypothetical protein